MDSGESMWDGNNKAPVVSEKFFEGIERRNKVKELAEGGEIYRKWKFIGWNRVETARREI